MKNTYEYLRRIHDELVPLPVVGDIVRQCVRLVRAFEKIYVNVLARISLRQAVSFNASAIEGLRDSHDRLSNELLISNARIEFVRNEIMFEIRRNMSRDERNPPSEPRILNVGKVNAQVQKNEVRLNVGCGHVQIDEYINVDARTLPGVDIAADVANIPLPLNSVAEIYASHLLEHFTAIDLSDRVLPHWVSLLKPNGVLRVVVPDTESMAAACVDGKMSFEDFREVLFGLQEYEGDFHFNMFSRSSLAAVLVQSGLVDVRISFYGRKNGKCMDMEATGRRPLE